MGASPTDLIAVRPVGSGDRSEWGRLYAGYVAFYETRLDDEQLELVWGWLKRLAASGSKGTDAGRHRTVA